MSVSLSRARKISIRLSSLLHGYLAGRLDDPGLARKLLALARDIEGDALRKPPPAPNPGVEAQLVRIFRHWRGRMNKTEATKLTDGRRRVIAARLKEGYAEPQILAAIDGCAASEFHMGENESRTAYNDLTHILRNGEKLEQFLEQREEQDHTHHEDPEIHRLQQEADQALKDGDTDAYNTANARIGACQAAGKANP